MNDTAGTSRLTRHPLVRMNGVGNAIVVLDLRGSDLVPSPDEVRTIAAAPGLRFDQLMTIHDPIAPATDAFIRIFNVDGSESGACGNGTRCVAWVLTRDDTREHLRLQSEAGMLDCRRVEAFRFSVDMGTPVFDPHRIPLRAGIEDHEEVELGIDDDAVAGLGRPFALSMGNPHAIFFVPDIEAIDIARLGPAIEHAPAFPERVNASFAEVVNPGRIRLRVWERGAGATLGCGTGACATLVAAAATGRSERRALVDLPGGPLEVEWRPDQHVIMTGAVEFEGETTLARALGGAPA